MKWLTDFLMEFKRSGFFGIRTELGRSFGNSTMTFFHELVGLSSFDIFLHDFFLSLLYVSSCVFVFVMSRVSVGNC